MLNDQDAAASEDSALQIVVELLDDEEVADQLSSCLAPNDTGGEEGESGTAETCWGAQASGLSTHCTPGFVPNKNHFQYKFCAECRSKGIHVPADRIRMIHDDGRGSFKNSKRAGFWSEDASSSALRFRRVNQASGCKGKPLLITNIPLPPSVAHLSPVPDSMIDPTTGTVHLVVCLGTLVPKAPAFSGPLIVQSRKRPVPKDTQEVEGAVHGRLWAVARDERPGAGSASHTSSGDSESQSSFTRSRSERGGGGNGDECSAYAGVLGSNLHDLCGIAQAALGNPNLEAERECPRQPHDSSPQSPTLHTQLAMPTTINRQQGSCLRARANG